MMADTVVLDGELGLELALDGDLNLSVPMDGEVGIITNIGGGGAPAVLVEKSVSANGVYNASADSADGYSKVTVAVPASAVDTGTKSVSITENGTTSEDVIGYASASITVNVPNTYTASDEGKVVDGGALVSQTSLSVTENDTYDTTTVNEVTVNVPGGGSADKSLEVTAIGSNGDVTAATWHGDIPGYGLCTCFYNIPGTFPTITFDGTETVGRYALNGARVNLDIPSMSTIKYAGQYAFAIFNNSSNDMSSTTLSMPEFTGLAGAGGSAATDVFRSTQTTCFKGYYLPKCTVVGQYWWYQYAVTGIDIQIGSIGYGVTSVGNRPFGGTSKSGTITLFCTGANLDTLKTNIMNGAGGSYTFVFKASEATTYGGVSYNAGDTMLTA